MENSKLKMWRKRTENAIRNVLDAWCDQRICGMSLETFAPAESEGAVDTISAPYGTLSVVLGHERFTARDRLLDVGCGMGRPLAYLVSRGFPGELEGVELNAEVARAAQKWTERYPKLRIFSGDAFELDLSRYTHLFMWYPMVPAVLERFVAKMDRELVRPTIVYYVGNIGGDTFGGHAGWKLREQGTVHRVHGLLQHWEPTSWYVWELDPAAAR